MSELPNEEFHNFQLFGIGKPTAKQSARRDKRKAFNQKLVDTVKHGGIEGIGKVIVNRLEVANPAAAIPRAAALGLVRVNFVGFASRMYPAFLSEAELKAKHFDVANAAKVKQAWEKASNTWFLLGGDPAGLKNYIIMGHDHPVFNTKKEKERERNEKGDFTKHFDGDEDKSNVAGGDDAVYAALIATGGSVVASLLSALSKAGAKKNPYEEGSAPAKAFDTAGVIDTAELSLEDKAKVDQIMQKAAEDKARGVAPGAGDHDEDGKIWGMPTGVAIGVFIAGGLLLVFGGYKLYKHLTK